MGFAGRRLVGCGCEAEFCGARLVMRRGRCGAGRSGGAAGALRGAGGGVGRGCEAEFCGARRRGLWRFRRNGV